MLENDNIDINDSENISNQNQNSFKEVSVIQSKENDSNSNKSSLKNFILYISIIIIIYISLIINYFKTNNWYDKNLHFINLQPINICKQYMTNLEKCLNQIQKSTSMVKKEGKNYVYDTKEICKDDNNRLEICFDRVHLFSKKCQIYLNDLYLCKNIKKESLEKCINNNLINCWRPFNIINISKVYEEL